MSRKRILFLAEGATMTHFVRPLALAGTLNPEHYEIHFYSPDRFLPHLRDQPFQIGDLESMPGEQFLANISKGAPLFPTDVLRNYVQKDRALIRSIKPDLIVGDMRLSLPISARLEDVPYGVIVNAYWSPYAERHSILPSVPATRVVPPRVLGPVYKITEKLAYYVHVAPVNRVRKEFGLPALPPDVRVMYTEGTYVLYADIPEFVPTQNAPRHHHYVGICPWVPSTPKPAWWERLRDDPKPKVFVSLGSSGPLRALPNLLGALSKMPVSVVLSTSGRVKPITSPQVYSADLLPFSETAMQSNVVVSHGGSGGLYPAIAAGTPVLAIPSNADQHLSTAFLTESGAGVGVRVEEASRKKLLTALETLLGKPQYRSRAKEWARVYSKYDSRVLFPRFLAGTSL